MQAMRRPILEEFVWQINLYYRKGQLKLRTPRKTRDRAGQESRRKRLEEDIYFEYGFKNIYLF
jgi:hypothetical protein